MTDNALIERYYTDSDKKAEDMFKYEHREACTKDFNTGEIIYQKDGLTFPEGYSQTAVNIVASKYFTREGVPETGEELDMRQMVGRVTNSLANFGEKNGYFSNQEEAETFNEELNFMILNQMYSPNSPTWFNAGKKDSYGISGNNENGLYFSDPNSGEIKRSNGEYEHPQCSACFILGLEDKLEGENGIKEWWSNEVTLYKLGSGDGANLGKLRAAGEPVSGGGVSSGAQSFARVSDTIGDVVKSGGITRRAAKMVMQESDHPEVLDFIDWKVDAEKQVRALLASGLYTPEEAYNHVSGQNSNNSVRMDNETLEAVVSGGTIDFIERKSGKVRDSMLAEEFLVKISAATHVSGDPGLQYSSTIDKFNPVKNSGRITGSNPCSEYMFLDDSACNLGSLNLMKFRKEDGDFDIDSFKHAVEVATLAQEIIVDYAGYPNAKIAENSHNFRPLGVGYANLGALLMINGIAYDSDYGREVGGAITSLLAGTVYEQSTKMAKNLGAFKEFEKNKKPFLEVLNLHKEAGDSLQERRNGKFNLRDIVLAQKETWQNTVHLAEQYGVRNAQGSLLAPTGTIGFLMDCDTTGIEPEFLLQKTKNLVGGGTEIIINKTVGPALNNLGYSELQIEDIQNFILENNHVEGAPHLKERHIPIFDTANASSGGTRFIEPMAHLKMMAAAQPFLSGAISKTVNLPSDSSIEDVFNLYLEGGKLGLKAVAIYRDGSKLHQPLVDSSTTIAQGLERGEKIHLEPTRESMTNVTTITNPQSGLNYKVHVITGEYPGGSLGEVRIQLSKTGSTMKGVYDALGISVSEGLKGGISLDSYAKKFVGTKTDISGATNDPLIRSCTSLEDLIFKQLTLNYGGEEAYKNLTGEYNFSLTSEQNRNLRINQNQETIRSRAYFKSIAEIDEKMSLTTLDAVKEYDSKNKKARGQKAKKSSERPKKSQSSGDLCECGGVVIPDGKCKKCTNCGKTVGGCAS